MEFGSRIHLLVGKFLFSKHLLALFENLALFQILSQIENDHKYHMAIDKRHFSTPLATNLRRERKQQCYIQA